MAIYRGVSGTNREVKRQFCGVGGTNREIKEQWRGVSGTNRRVYAGYPQWSMYVRDTLSIGSESSVTISVPASTQSPTVITLKDPRTYAQSGLLSIGIQTQRPVSMGDTITFDWKFDRLGITGDFLNLVIGPVWDSQSTFKSAVRTFARVTENYVVKHAAASLAPWLFRAEDPYGGIGGILTIYDIKHNGVKIL